MLQINTVVQITENGPDGWVECFVTVSEVKSWGIQGYVQIPMEECRAYIRLKPNQFQVIGTAVLTVN